MIAKKSQTSGERKLGQIRRSLGYGIIQKQPGPAQVTDGNIAANHDANTVIASAHRVTGRRQSHSQAQNGRDQRAGVANAYPEHEVSDVKCPEDRRVDAPDAEAE